jgi:hypothetical protein
MTGGSDYTSFMPRLNREGFLEAKETILVELFRSEAVDWDDFVKITQFQCSCVEINASSMWLEEVIADNDRG